MGRVRIGPVAAAAAAVLLAAACTAPPAPAPAAAPPAGGAARLLPGAGTVPGWAPADDVQRFAGDDLFLFIDGGADLYLEYGFREAAARSYRGPGGAAVNVEVYEMGDPAAAFGVFSIRRGDGGEDVPVGSAARRADYYLNVWKGRYLATLIGLDRSAATRAGLEALGRAVAAAIPGEAPPPALAAALPAAGLDAGSVRYFRGPVAAANVPRGDTAVPWRAPEGVYGRYDGAALFLLAWADAEAARAALERMAAAGGTAADAAEGFAVAAPDGSPGRAERRGRRVALVIGGSAAQRTAVLRQLNSEQ